MPDITDPFGAGYFAEALRAAEMLVHAPTLRTMDAFDIVKKLDGPHARIEVARRGDGTLLALKSFRTSTRVTAFWFETRQNEAFGMILHGYGGLLPITQTLNYGGYVRYLCTPFCQGGNLRDRMAAGSLTIEELAYHGLAVTCAMAALHTVGKVHGDIKPENILFGRHQDEAGGEQLRWRTRLSDLETLVETGQPTSWRMTPAYAAPEQIAGAVAAPAMDVWAWGATMREGLAVARASEAGWSWLLELVDRASSEASADRPAVEEIIETYGRHVGFSDPAEIGGIGAREEAAAWYPTSLLPDVLKSWDRHNAHVVIASFGWAAWLSECIRLYEVRSVPALLRIEELCGRVLGDPSDPESVWNMLHRDRSAGTVLVGIDAAVTFEYAPTPSEPMRLMPRNVAWTYVRELATALIALFEATGAQPEAARLGSVASAWDALGEFGSDVDAAILAQAWLCLGDLERALPHVRRSFSADCSNFSARAAMHLYYELAGDFYEAATVALPESVENGVTTLMWMQIAMRDLLAAGDYEAFDRMLTAYPYGVVDSLELMRAVRAGRGGPLQPEPTWLKLRDHFSSFTDPGDIQTIRYLLEAAFQRGDIEFARRRAAVARTHPAVRMPVNHLNRVAIEAVALGRDPAHRGLTARLNNRAELWSADGRPNDDLLSGVSLVVGQRWIDGPGSSELSVAAKELVRRSELLLAQDIESTAFSVRHCAGCREPGRVEDVSVCGACHRVYCPRCVERADHSCDCPCGGDLVHPLAYLSRRASARSEAMEVARWGNGNILLLDPSNPIAQRLEHAASLWESSLPEGKQVWLTHGKAFFMAYCWFIVDRSRVTPVVRAYIQANYEARGGGPGWGETLHERLECDWCRETYRGENMQICVGCVKYVCIQCSSHHSRSSCEIVG